MLKGFVRENNSQKPVMGLSGNRQSYLDFLPKHTKALF